MAKVKHTKNALKAQRDALRRYQRYLPTLQLKKQQLQLEVRRIENTIESKEAEQKGLWEDLGAWVRLFSGPVVKDAGTPFEFGEYLQVEAVRMSVGNVAGVSIPVLDGVDFRRAMPDLFLTPSWVDDGLRMFEHLARLRAEQLVLAEQHRLLREELRITNQRVNLFEKVKIPECLGGIRVIRIFLGDQQTADVARAKLAKGRSVEKVRAA